MIGKIHIISCGIDTPFPSEQINKVLAESDILAGSDRLLENINSFSGRTLVFDRHTKTQVENLIADAENGASILILASGDSLFHGISGTVLRACEGKECEGRAREGKELCVKIEPAVTAFQALFSRLHLPWAKARFFSVHGGEPLPCREILSTSLCTIYGGNRLNGSSIAKELISFNEEFRSRKAVLADRLGLSDEQIVKGTLAELAENEVSPLSILLLLPPEQSCQSVTLPLGAEDSFYEHEKGLITSQEVRAIALSKLKLPSQGILWDIGAGSGSVGIEAGALLPDLSVHSVEKNSSRISNIKENIRRVGITNVSVHEGDALSVIESIPAPDRVFIGGGGKDIIDILDNCYQKLKRDGVIVLSAVTLQTINRVQNWNQINRISSLTIDIAREETLGKSSYSMVRPDNRITILIWEKK